MLKNLSEREWKIVITGTIFVSVIGLWLGVIEPFSEKRETLIRKIEVKSNELLEVRDIAEKLYEKKQRLKKFETRLRQNPSGVAPISVMENLAQSAGLAKNIGSISPLPPSDIDGYKESSVEIKIVKAPLASITAFLEEISSTPDRLRIKRISIKPRYEDPSLLDVSMSVASYELAR